MTFATVSGISASIHCILRIIELLSVLLLALPRTGPFGTLLLASGLIVGIMVGVAADICLGWLYLTDKCVYYRREPARQLKEGASDRAAEFIGRKTFIPKKAASLVAASRC